MVGFRAVADCIPGLQWQTSSPNGPAKKRQNLIVDAPRRKYVCVGLLTIARRSIKNIPTSAIENPASSYIVTACQCCHSCAGACCQTRDCFVALLLAMTKAAFSCHCEAYERGRGNLKCPAIVFGNRPAGGNPSLIFLSFF